LSEWESLLEQYRTENAELSQQLHDQRSAYYEKLSQASNLQQELEAVSLQVQHQTRKQELANQTADQYKAQLTQLQNYVRESSVIREQFESHRIANNQIEIMQDLRMENVSLLLQVNKMEAL